MADEEITVDDAAVALAERPEAPAQVAAPKLKRKKTEEDDAPEYEMAFDTPFGALELEMEPRSSKEKRELRKREQAAAAAAKAAEKAARRAAKHPPRPEGESRGHGLLIALLIFAIIAAAVAVAFWLFARPGEEEPEDLVPEDMRNPEMVPVAEPEPQGFVAGAQRRIKTAIRAGRSASRETQKEQERRYREMTRG